MSCRPSAQSAAILILALTLLSSTFLSETVVMPGLVVDDLLGIAQPRAGEGDLDLGAALAADRTNRAQRGRGRARPRAHETRRQQAARKKTAESHEGASTTVVDPGGSGEQVLDDLAAVDDLDRAGCREPSAPCRRRFPAGDRRSWPGLPGRSGRSRARWPSHSTGRKSSPA